MSQDKNSTPNLPLLERMINKINRLRETRVYKVFKWSLLLIIALVAIALFDTTNLLENLSQLSILSILLAVCFLFAARVLYSLRWQTILHGFDIQPISLVYLVRILLLAEFMSIAMPSYLGGDGVRWLKLEKQVQNPARVATSILLDRIVGFGTLILITLLFSQPLASLVKISFSVWLILGGIGIGVLCVVLFILWIWQAGRAMLTNLIERFRIQPSQLITAIFISLLGHFVFAQAYFILFSNLVSVDYFLVISITVAALTTRALPFSVIGIEASDGSLIGLMSLASVATETTLIVLVVIVGSRYLFAAMGLLVEVMIDGRKILEKRQG